MLGVIPTNVAPRWGWPHDPETCAHPVFLRSSLKGNVHSGMRLGWIFLQAILYGFMDRTLLVSILPFKYFAVAWRIGWMSSKGWKQTMDTLERRPRKWSVRGARRIQLRTKWCMRSRQETINGRLKNWAILNVMYCHDLMEHEIFFGPSLL